MDGLDDRFAPYAIASGQTRAFSFLRTFLHGAAKLLIVFSRFVGAADAQVPQQTAAIPDVAAANPTTSQYDRFPALHRWQPADAGRERFALLANHTVGFRVGSYDRSKPLVIDRTRIYGSYPCGTAGWWDRVIPGVKRSQT